MEELIAKYEEGVEVIRAKDLKGGIALLEPLLNSAIDFARREHARMLIGYAYSDLQQWDKSIEYFKTAMLNDIECLPARTALGHSYIMTKRYDDALEAFRTAVQLAPNSAQAHHGLGWALLEIGKDLDEALYQIQEALRIEPNSAAILDSLGWALYKMGDIDEATKQLEKAVEIDPDNRTILEHRKVIRTESKKRAERKDDNE